MKCINAVRTTIGAEGPLEKRICCYSQELSNKRKRQQKFQIGNLNSCLPPANQMLTVDSLLNSRVKGFQRKTNLYSIPLCLSPVWFLGTLK